ncbi:MAG TPA: class I SAM-dependent methyltransferase [Bacteroidota bacterium]|nr:class I SAM-dependent methyltransferase [Bacteroidota bacterium]
MKQLEDRDRGDRSDGTSYSHRLKQIPPDVGKFLALLAAGAPPGEFVEIGTSAGYSALWISLVTEQRGIKLKTFEVLPHKIELARETFSLTARWNSVELVEGNFLEKGTHLQSIAFCFLDCDKAYYEQCYELVAARLVPQGLLVIDNALSHFDEIKPIIDKICSDERLDSMIVPIGNGELVCRRKPTA